MGFVLTKNMEKHWKIARRLDGSPEDLSKIEIKAKEILDKRYEECDAQGHLTPNRDKDTCDYCYRRLTSQHPGTDALIEESKDLPLIGRPCNAQLVRKLESQEKETQQFIDYVRGIKLIVEGL